MKPTLIYALKDSSTQEVRYVGKTVNPNLRRWQHKKAKDAKSYCARWIRSINGLIDFVELEWVMPGGDWIEAERRWISYYRDQNARLTNVTGGGEGCYSPTQEYRDRISARTMGNQYAKGYRHTPEAIQKISDANRGKGKALGHRHDEATKKKIGDASRGKINSPETIGKMKDAHQALSGKKSEDMLRVWKERKDNWVSKYDDKNIILDYLSGQVGNKELLRKYSIGSTSTLYVILRRNNISLKGATACDSISAQALRP